MMKRYSIIIPQRDCAALTRRCLESIPDRQDIEVIVIDDNSKNEEELRCVEKEIQRSSLKFIYTDEGKGAGYARNVGLKQATGEWLIFSDADDFFTNNAFDVFDRYADTDNDYVTFYHKSVYSDTLEPCIRYSVRNKYLDAYLKNPSKSTENKLKYADIVPWAKMMRRSIAVVNDFKFDEVPASNDVTFVSHMAYKSRKFVASSEYVYVLTYRKGSITRINNKENDYSRYIVSLKFNLFLTEIGCGNLKSRVLSRVLLAWRRFGWKEARLYIKEAHNYKQSMFTGLLFNYDSLKEKLKMLFKKNTYSG